MTSDTSLISIEALDAEDLRGAFVKAGEYLSLNQAVLDNLNVFPVPDGDTGANMVATLQAGLRALGDRPASSLRELSESMRRELLRNSRGNSGFIVAWFFSGFLAAVERHERLTRAELLEGFENGAYQVNSSLFTPVEGTMITIIAAMTRALHECPVLDIGGCLRHALAAARESLFLTPTMLPLLAKAGVVDAGALGFIFIVEGMLRGLTNASVTAEPEDGYRFKPDPAALVNWKPQPEYRYCTEVYVEDPRGCDGGSLRDFLGSRGNSIALVIDPRFIKLHIHTDDPDDVIGYLGAIGRIGSSKVEDMREQAAAVVAAHLDGSACAVLACVPGPGFAELFAGLGVARCLEYGRELPSAGAILDALTEIDAPAVIILPNNANIAPAATLARDLCGRDVVVVPTRNVVEGVAAAYGYSENDGLGDNARNMGDCVGLAACLCLYRSASDSTFGDLAIPEGAYFVMSGDEVAAMGDDPVGAALEALGAAGLAGKSNVSAYLGRDFDPALLDGLRAGVAAINPDAEFESLYGGQGRELLIISLE